MNIKHPIRHKYKWFFITIAVILVPAVVLFVVSGMLLPSNTPDSQAPAMIEKGDSLYHTQEFVEALGAYTEALKHSRGKNDRTYYQAISRIGTIFDVCGDQERALYYYRKVIENCNADQFPEIMAGIAVKMTVCYYNKNDLENTDKYYKLQSTYPLYDYKYRDYYRLTGEGLVAVLSGDYPQAIRAFRQTLYHVRKADMDTHNEIPIALELADVYMKVAQPDSALFYLKRGEVLSQRNGLASNLMDIYRAMSDYYNLMEDSVNSKKYKLKSEAIADSTFSQTQFNKASIDLLNAHDVEAKSEIKRLSSKISTQTWIIIAFVLLSVSLIAVLLMLRLQHLKLYRSYQLIVDKDTDLLPAVAPNPVSSTVSGKLKQYQVQELLDKINQAMADVALISNPDFSLETLSRHIGSNTRYVSAVINESYGMNFKTLLNEHRIREAVRLLTNPNSTLSVADVAISTGYNSSTSFINAFKKIKGMPPAVYRRLAAERAFTQNQKLLD